MQGGLALTAVRNRPERERLVCRHTSSGALLTCPIRPPAYPPQRFAATSYQAKNAQGTLSNTGHATVIFLAGALGASMWFVRRREDPAACGHRHRCRSESTTTADHRRGSHLLRRSQVPDQLDRPALRPTSCRRCRCRAWAITSTRLTCKRRRGLRRRGLVRRPDKASVGGTLPSPATSANGACRTAAQKQHSIRALSISIGQALLPLRSAR